MAVSIYYKKTFWGAGSSLGYLVINTTADFITEPSLKKQLQEIDEYNLGVLSLDDITEPNRSLIRETILEKAIPQIKASHRSAEVLKLLDDLAMILSK